MHDEEERAARMYDRAMILEKGRAAKTNFPITDYDGEVANYQTFCAQRCACAIPHTPDTLLWRAGLGCSDLCCERTLKW